MHEVITLQLGQRSNFLATHFWNLQESYFTYSEHEEPFINHDIHFRAGIGADGTDTFTPRTVIYDLKGGFGSLRKINALYEVETSGPIRGVWDGTTSTQQHMPIEQTQYQKNLEQGLPTFQLRDSDVRYWSDFNRLFYHPRSIVQLNDYELNSQLMPFEKWANGEDLFQSLDKEHDLLDRDFRPFAEECDQMQAIQVFTGTDDAWGGFASNYIENLRDEFGKTSIWVWGLEDGGRVPWQKQAIRSTNAAYSLRSMAQQASAYTRLSTPPRFLPSQVSIGGSSEWTATALVCSALESSTLPTRVTGAGGRQGTYAQFEACLNADGRRNVFELQASIPTETVSNGLNDHGSTGALQNGTMMIHEDTRSVQDEPPAFDIHFAPKMESEVRSHHHYLFGQVETRRSSSDAAISSHTLNHHDHRMNRDPDEPIIEIFKARQPFPLLDTFPSTLFHTNTGSHPRQLNLNASLSCTSRTKESIFHLRNTTRRTMDLEEREAVYNDLTELGESYAHGWESGSDEVEDD